MSDDERLNAYELFKAFSGTVGMLGVGVLLLVGPEPMREEISDTLRVRAGIGMLALGFLFALTVILSQQRARWAQALAVRGKGLLLFTVLSGLVALAVLRLHAPVREAWTLSREGQPAQAVVTKRYGWVGGARNGLQYVLECEGARRRIRLPGPYSEGQRLAVLRSAEDPEVMLPGVPGDGFLDLIAQNPGRNTAGWLGGLGLLAVLGALFGLKRFLLGKH